MIPIKPHLSQLQSSNYNKYPDLQSEMEDIQDKLSNEKQKRTIVFYSKKLIEGKDNISLYIPFKGRIKRIYAKLSDESTEDLNISIKKETGEVITSLLIEKGNDFRSTLLNYEMDYEMLTASLEGEAGLENITVCLDVILE